MSSNLLEEGELECAEEGEEGEIILPNPKTNSPHTKHSSRKVTRGRNEQKSSKYATMAPTRTARKERANEEDDFEFMLKSYVQDRGALDTPEYTHVDKKRKRDHDRYTPNTNSFCETTKTSSKKNRGFHNPIHRDYTKGRNNCIDIDSRLDTGWQTNDISDERPMDYYAHHTAPALHVVREREPRSAEVRCSRVSSSSEHNSTQEEPQKQKPRPASHRSCSTICKLELVVDIDHTLVHSTTDPKARDIFEKADNTSGMVHFTLPGQSPVYYVKFRPKVAAFLDVLQPMFDFHIYTMGTRAYAEKIISILDPNKQMFGRILAREDHLGIGDKTTKQLENYFEEDRVLILDDRDDVWRQSGSANLIKIDPFLFFEGLSDSNAPPITPLSIQELIKAHPFPTLDNSMVYLDSLVDLLRMVHQEYFNQKVHSNAVDVREILAKIRSQVLAGCHVVFSGIFPLQIEHNKLPNTKIWKTTELFGATVSLDINERTTHLIAVKSGTLKVARAQQLGVKIIHLGWLRDCVKYFTKLEEDPYLLPNTYKADKISVNTV